MESSVMKRITKLTLVVAALSFSLSAIVISSMARSSSTASLQSGVALFGAKCALCHGKDGTGVKTWKSKGIPNFTDAQWHSRHSDDQIAETIRNGKGKYMPKFKDKLSEEQIRSLVGAVRQFKK
jgi:cbb3-type cytochrome c oxidase subunit III